MVEVMVAAALTPILGKRAARRFWSSIEKQPGDDGHWLWTGSVDRYGVGKVHSRGRPHQVRRIAWELEHGVLPPHARLHLLCGEQRCVRPTHFELYLPPQTDFGIAFDELLQREQLTLAEVARRAEVSDETIRRWQRDPDASVMDEHARRVADVLNEPSLIDLLATRSRLITLTCTEPDCGNVESRLPGDLRRQIKEAQQRGAIVGFAFLKVDYEAGTASGPCGHCIRSADAKRRFVEPYMKRYGHAYFVKKGKEMRKAMTPEQVDRALAAANAARVSPMPEELRRSIGQGHIRPRPEGYFGHCPYCLHVTYRAASEPGPPGPPEHHRECFREAAQAGQATPPARDGRRYSSNELADIFALAVCALLKGHVIGHRDGEGLANEFDIDNRTARRRITWLIEHLPPNDRGGQRLALWGSYLREAYDEHRAEYMSGVAQT